MCVHLKIHRKSQILFSAFQIDYLEKSEQKREKYSTPCNHASSTGNNLKTTRPAEKSESLKHSSISVHVISVQHQNITLVLVFLACCVYHF